MTPNYHGSGAPDYSPIVVDLETCGLSNALQFLDAIPDAVPDTSPVEAAKNLTDPAKIAADIEKRTAARAESNAAAVAKVEQQRAAQISKMALDWNVGRIVALGWWSADTAYTCYVCHDEVEEAAALTAFWAASKHRLVIGFNVKNFDGPYLIQRSRYLGIQPADLDLGRYSKRGVIDLFHELTFNDAPATSCMRRGLKAFCRRFGIPVPDDTDGAEIPALALLGDWEGIRAHCVADVALTVALAQRLNLVKLSEPVGAL